MAFEKEIKEAKKVSDGWLARSQSDHQFFIDVKKENVAWEKKYTKMIEDAINSGDAKGALSMIESSRDTLKDIQSQCEDRHKKHSDFVRGNPRKGSVGVAEEMRLRKGTPAYDAVSDAMDKVLIAHTKQFKATEEAWLKDLLMRIELLRSKLDTLEKLAKGSEGKMVAYAKQLVKDTAAFKAQMDKSIVALKPSMAELAIKSIQSDKDKWLSGQQKQQRDQYQVFKDRVDLVDKMLDLSEKNLKRILKSIPPEVLKQKFVIGRELKALNEVYETANKGLKNAQGAFKLAIAVFEKSYPNLV